MPVKKLIKKLGRLFLFDSKMNPEFADDKGFSCTSETGYNIYINQDLPGGMDNFTYGHEMAHIVLNHHLEFDVEELTDKELWMLDREADIFSANLLMPEDWVHSNLNLPLTVPEIGRLKTLFDVSWNALINRFHELGIQRKEEINRLFTEWKTQKEIFYNCTTVSIHSTKTSSSYDEEVVIESINYKSSEEIKVKRDLNMSEPFIFPEIDEDMRFLKCPNCGNSDFSSKAKFCKKCGHYLYNICTNVQNDPREMSNWCGENNVPDALYCEYCGCITAMGEYIKNLKNSQKPDEDLIEDEQEMLLKKIREPLF
ncbi:ImmA/IrrE family metallo-endopeptidase [Desulforamulus putei]|uniref:ImmA/IrrE family metallo-endopeptidase n=1 Tax=Desulforamulus putei TaxID=74701 RepID=UPI002FDD21F5